MTKDDWLTSNLLGRKGTNEPFKLTIKPTRFDKVPYRDATMNAAREIGNLSDKIFVALSGGMDSESVVRIFHSAGVKLYPIIVAFSGNELERQYAFRVCEELKIEPIVIDMTNIDIVKYYIMVGEYVDNVAVHSLPTIRAQMYAKEHGGILVTGDEILPSNDHIDSVLWYEWDYYHSMISRDNVGFFIYSAELVYSMMNEWNSMCDVDNTQKCKSRLYNVVWRPKINHRYDKEVYESIRKISLEIRGPEYDPLKKHLFEVFKSKIPEFLASMIAP